MVCLFCNTMKLVLKYLIKVIIGARKKYWSKKILAILGKGSPAKSCSPAISSFPESWTNVGSVRPRKLMPRVGRFGSSGRFIYSNDGAVKIGSRRFVLFRVDRLRARMAEDVLFQSVRWRARMVEMNFWGSWAMAGGLLRLQARFRIEIFLLVEVMMIFLFMLKIFDHHLLWHRLWSWFWAWATRMVWRERKGGQGWSRGWSRP